MSGYRDAYQLRGMQPATDREPRDKPTPARSGSRRRKLSELPNEHCVLLVCDLKTDAVEQRLVLNPHREDSKARIRRTISFAINNGKYIEIVAVADEKHLTD